MSVVSPCYLADWLFCLSETYGESGVVERGREGEGKRDREREGESGREGETDRECLEFNVPSTVYCHIRTRDRQTDREKDGETETDRDRQADRDTERHREIDRETETESTKQIIQS